MNTLSDNIQKLYGYSNYEMALIKYVLVSIASEFSKLLFLGVFYLYIGKFDLFVSSFALLLLLRFNGGGYHCKHYITCLLMTFTISLASIVLLQQIQIANYSIIIFTLIICLIANYIIGPIASPFRPKPDSILLKNCKNNGFIVILFFIIFVSIFNTMQSIEPYLIVGYWTVILHTFQMIFAKILQKGGFIYEKA